MHGFECECIRCKSLLENYDIEKIKSIEYESNPTLKYINNKFKQFEQEDIPPVREEPKIVYVMKRG